MKYSILILLCILSGCAYSPPIQSQAPVNYVYIDRENGPIILKEKLQSHPAVGIAFYNDDFSYGTSRFENELRAFTTGELTFVNLGDVFVQSKTYLNMTLKMIHRQYPEIRFLFMIQEIDPKAGYEFDTTKSAEICGCRSS